MADVKISALPAATTPLAGTEVLPIVQSGTTDQVSVANLTAGRTVNGAAFTATGTVSGATVTASGTVSGATVSGATVSGTTVSGTTVNAGAGTVSAPSISPTGDSNTGIFFPAADTIAFAEGGVEALRLDSTGNATFTGTAVMSSSFLRNRLINGNMYIAQRATSATVTAGTGVPTASTGYPCVDRFFVYSTGANVTAAQVSGAGANRNLLRITGAASVTAVGIGQRIETVNSIDLAGQTCTLSVDLANSLLTTVTWTASYATTADTFGTIGTPTKTQIATGTFTITSTLTRYSVNIAVPAAATTGVEILFTVGAQTSGTWDVGNVQFEPGTIATPFERRQFGQELDLCQRYFQLYSGLFVASSPSTYPYMFSTTKRATPTIASAAAGFALSGVTPTVDHFWATQTTGAAITVTASSEL
jgi:hypothetical protein